MEWVGNSSLRFTKAKEGDTVEFYMIHLILIEKIIKIGTDQTVELPDLNLVENVEVDQGMNKIMREEILEVMWEHIKILEDRIVGKSIEEIIEMKIITENEVRVVFHIHI